MLRMGERKTTAPIGYNQFARIFNVAPGVPVTFAYIPEGQETLMGLDCPKPNRDDFKVSPRDLYNVRQVAPRGSQFLSPSRAGIMTQMLWRNAENASRGHRGRHLLYDDNLGIEGMRGKRRHYNDHYREMSMAASSSGITDDLNDIEIENELTPPPDNSPMIPNIIPNPNPTPTNSSDQDQAMGEPILESSGSKNRRVSARGEKRRE